MNTTIKATIQAKAQALRLPIPWLLMLALLPAAAAQAAEPAPQTTVTQAWLDLQAGGSAAPTDERPMPGEIADKVYQRYVDSFSQPIPETLKRDNFVSQDSGGG